MILRSQRGNQRSLFAGRIKGRSRSFLSPKNTGYSRLERKSLARLV
jgi:hypothetical protein